MEPFLMFFQNGGVGAIGGILPLILIMGVFYVLLIRPQQKRQRQLQDTIATLKVGDRVVTNGGIIGVITTVKEATFFIRSAHKSIVEVARNSIAGIDEDEKK